MLFITNTTESKTLNNAKDIVNQLFSLGNLSSSFTPIKEPTTIIAIIWNAIPEKRA